MPKAKSKVARDLPFRSIAQFWNWIPAFRAVAEVGGVNEAARLLRVSPSALSRTVGLLESALGEPLFHREGALTLTSRGERLLAASRDAMRLLHEAADLETTAGAFTLGTTSRLGAYRLLPAIHEMRSRWPRLEIRTRTVRQPDVAGMLLRGQLDVVVALGQGAPTGLVSAPLPPARCHVYCGRGHPLHPVKSPDEATVTSHPFAAPPGDPEPGASVYVDSWPAERPRRVALHCDSIEPAIDACQRGELLACLPEEIVAALGLRQALRRLPRPRLPGAALQCLYRRPVGAAGRLVLDVVRLLEAAPAITPK